MARRVQTSEGAKYFGAPVGAMITPDMEDDAKAKHGGRRAPAGSYTGSNQKRAGTSDNKTASPVAGTTPYAPTDWSSKGFKKPTLKGPVTILAGTSKFSAPEGSNVHKSPKHPGRVYVITPDGLTHVYTSKGELNITSEESQSLTAEIQARFGNTSENLEVEDEEEITWVRLKSLIDLIEQAEKAGDTSQAEKLMSEFISSANKYDPEVHAKTLKAEITK